MRGIREGRKGTNSRNRELWVPWLTSAIEQMVWPKGRENVSVFAKSVHVSNYLLLTESGKQDRAPNCI